MRFIIRRCNLRFTSIDIATRKFQLGRVGEHVLSPEKVVDHLVNNFEAYIIDVSFDHFRESNLKVPRYVDIEEFLEKPGNNTLTTLCIYADDSLMFPDPGRQDPWEGMASSI